LIDPTQPTVETIALYRELPSEALMVLRTAFESDITKRGLSADARRFIRGRLDLIDSVITERTTYEL
jgi:hypothetical protein